MKLGEAFVVFEEVRLHDYFMRQQQLVLFFFRDPRTHERFVLDADNELVPVSELAATNEFPRGITLPYEALDALVEAHKNAAAPQPATARHLDDAIETRDRLLALVESFVA